MEQKHRRQALMKWGRGKHLLIYIQFLCSLIYSLMFRWNHFDSDSEPRYSPHYVSYIWAVMLWGYHQYEYAPLLTRAQAGLSTLLEGFPNRWIPTSNGIAMQRARILFPLAWLVRVNNTELNRKYLDIAIESMLTRLRMSNVFFVFVIQTLAFIFHLTTYKRL